MSEGPLDMLLIVKPSENTGFGAEIFANVQISQTPISSRWRLTFHQRPLREHRVRSSDQDSGRLLLSHLFYVGDPLGLSQPSPQSRSFLSGGCRQVDRPSPWPRAETLFGQHRSLLSGQKAAARNVLFHCRLFGSLRVGLSGGPQMALERTSRFYV